MADPRNPEILEGLLSNDEGNTDSDEDSDSEEDERAIEEGRDVEVDEDSGMVNYPKSEGLSTQQSQELLKKFGPNKLPEKVKPKWLQFAEILWQPLPMMIWAAAIVEFGIGDYVDGAILIGINMINGSLSYYETSKAGNAIAALKKSLKPTACCFRDGHWDAQFDATLLVPGDLVQLCSGAAVPADCMVNHGEIDVDESAMTGESLPVTLQERQMAKMGGSIVRGEVEATVVFTGPNTFFGKTATLLGGDKGKNNMQKMLEQIMIILVILSIALCTISLVYLLLDNQSVIDSFSFAVVVLVASIPMAIEIVVLTTLAVGARGLSKFGAIVSRLSAIEDLAGMNMLCSDKTGTLTKNKMIIQEMAPTFEPNVTQRDLLLWAALAARWDSPPKDALDTLVLRCPLWAPGQLPILDPTKTPQQLEEMENRLLYDNLQKATSGYERLDHLPFDPVHKRTESTIQVKETGMIFKVTKGAPHVIQALDKDTKKGDDVHHVVQEFGKDGVRSLAIAVSEPIPNWTKENEPPAVWHLQGLLSFLDPPRDDTKETIRRAEAFGCPVKMITGDHLFIAKKTAKDLNMGNVKGPNWPNIQGPGELPLLGADGKTPDDLKVRYGPLIDSADGFAQVFPEHKFLIVECYRQLGYKTGMTGDGVNDAPALKQADVGIAVSGSTDAARAAASIVLTREGLSTIVEAIIIARQIFRRMKSFLTYRIAATLQILTFFFIALFAFVPSDYVPSNPPEDMDSSDWPDYFSLPVLMLIIITVLNDGSLCSIGYDNAEPSQIPEKWNLKVLFLIASVLGGIACVSSLLLLWLCLDSWNENSVFSDWGINPLKYGEVINVMFLQIAVTDFLTLVTSRTQENFFWTSKPSMILTIAAGTSLTLSTILALVWPTGDLNGVPVYGLGHGDHYDLAAYTWIYCIIVFLIQDITKCWTFFFLKKYNIFDINGTEDAKKKRKLDIELRKSRKSKKRGIFGRLQGGKKSVRYHHQSTRHSTWRHFDPKAEE